MAPGKEELEPDPEALPRNQLETVEDNSEAGSSKTFSRSTGGQLAVDAVDGLTFFRGRIEFPSSSERAARFAAIAERHTKNSQAQKFTVLAREQLRCMHPKCLLSKAAGSTFNDGQLRQILQEHSPNTTLDPTEGATRTNLTRIEPPCCHPRQEPWLLISLTKSPEHLLKD